MSWADDYYAGTYQTDYGSTGVAKTYYVKQFIEAIKEKVRMVPLGQPQPLPEGNGKTVNWDRYLPWARSVSSASLTEGIMPNATQYMIQQLTKDIAEYGAWAQTTNLMDETFIHKKGAPIVAEAGAHAAEIIDLVTLREVASNGGYPLRADYATDTGATFKGTIDAAGSTYFSDTALSTNTDYGDADHDLNMSVVIITDGDGYGQARAVTAYDYTGNANGEGNATVLTWDKNPSVGDQYVVTTYDGIASGDKLTWANTKHAVALLRMHKAKPSDNGYYVGVADHFMLELLMDESKWTDVNNYQQDGMQIFKGEVGKFAGVRWLDMTNPFKFPITTRGTNSTSYGPGENGANQTETGSGLVSLAHIMGQNAYGVTSLAKKNPEKAPVYIKSPDQLGQPIPRFSTVGWMLEYMCKALNPMWVINMGLYDAA